MHFSRPNLMVNSFDWYFVLKYNDPRTYINYVSFLITIFCLYLDWNKCNLDNSVLKFKPWVMSTYLYYFSPIKSCGDMQISSSAMSMQGKHANFISKQSQLQSLHCIIQPDFICEEEYIQFSSKGYFLCFGIRILCLP